MTHSFLQSSDARFAKKYKYAPFLRPNSEMLYINMNEEIKAFYHQEFRRLLEDVYSDTAKLTKKLGGLRYSKQQLDFKKGYNASLQDTLSFLDTLVASIK